MITKEKIDINKISILYDLVYSRADKLFKQYNPCNITIHNNGRVTCLEYSSKGKYLCCGYCQGHYWNNGCTTNCLKCKLYICAHIKYYNEYNKCTKLKLSAKQQKELKVFIKKIKHLQELWRKIQERYKLPYIQFYWSKEKYIDLLREINEIQY